MSALDFIIWSYGFSYLDSVIRSSAMYYPSALGSGCLALSSNLGALDVGCMELISYLSALKIDCWELFSYLGALKFG